MIEVLPKQTSMAYVKGFKYQLHEEISFIIPELAPYAPIVLDYIEVREGGELVLKKGLASDGASGPTYDTPSSMRGAFVHDALYKLMRLGLIPRSFRQKADRIITILCKMDGMYGWRAESWYKFLRWFGHKAVQASSRRKIRYAP